MSTTLFLEYLLRVSEKAANIARVCRQNKHLFELLVQEKKNEEKNARFVQDFKTLADVLIQEMVKHDIGSNFPEIAEYIKGEETNTFCNTIGDKITVKIESTESETASLLSQVLNGNTIAAQLLAYEVHREIPIDQVNTVRRELPIDLEIPIGSCGVWIDPIDSTAEYISGDEGVPILDEIYSSGLKCVTVLIGVYDRRTGVPVMGVINQPFHRQVDSEWHGKCEWGIHHNTTQISSVINPSKTSVRPTKLIVVSGSEDSTLKSYLAQSGYELIETAGAGYKLLCVIQDRVDIYLLSRGSTFRWDTCSPHAILRSLGGDLFNYHRAVDSRVKQGLDSTHLSINYEMAEVGKVGVDAWCNKDGVIAFRDLKLAEELIQLLADK